jgi:hypothetical protein
MASPVLGPAGNAEFLLHARAHAGQSLDAGALDVLFDSAVSEAPDAVEG